jgi:hypothetical protein
MRPDIMVTDELSMEDCKAVQRAKNAGITVIASAHLTNMEKIPDAFLGLFDFLVLLDEKEIGKIKGIFDGYGRAI